MLPDIYSESKIYMKWKHRSDDTDCEHAIDLDKKENTKQKGTSSAYLAVQIWQNAIQSLHATSNILNSGTREARD